MHTLSGGGGDKFSAGGIFHGEGSFQGVNLLGEITHWGNLPEFLYNLCRMPRY